MSVIELAAARRTLASAVQAWKHKPADLAGGTFTVSNLGPLGIDWVTLVINPPQVAIMGVGRLRFQEVAYWPEEMARRRCCCPSA